MHSFKNETNEIAKLITILSPPGMEQLFVESGLEVSDINIKPPPFTNEQIQKLPTLASKNTSKAEEGIREVLTNVRHNQVETISDLDSLHDLIEGDTQNICIFNTHGEVFPLSRNGDYHHYLHRLGEKIYNDAWNLINLTGIPFCYYWHDNDTNQASIGRNLADGLNEILELSPTRVSNILPTVNILTGQGSVALCAVNIRIPSQISISRCVNFSNALPKVVFYGMSTTYGSAVLPIGRGHLIFNGMWGLDLGNSPNYHTDKFLGKIGVALFIFFAHRASEPPNTLWEIEDLSSTIDRKLGFMLRNDHGRVNGK